MMNHHLKLRGMICSNSSRINYRQPSKAQILNSASLKLWNSRDFMLRPREYQKLTQHQFMFPRRFREFGTRNYCISRSKVPPGWECAYYTSLLFRRPPPSFSVPTSAREVYFRLLLQMECVHSPLLPPAHTLSNFAATTTKQSDLLVLTMPRKFNIEVVGRATLPLVPPLRCVMPRWCLVTP